MKIKELNDPLLFIALKRVCTYLVNEIWSIQLICDDLIEAEFKLAVVQSKKYKDDIKLLADIDTELSWGEEKANIDDKHWSISKTGDFNPWYSGNLELKDLLDSIETVVDFELKTDQEIKHCELAHYYRLLMHVVGDNEPVITIENDIEKIKKLMTDVSTGLFKIQDKNDEYKSLYKKIERYYNRASIKNPNKFADLWEFYDYWKKKLSTYTERRVYVAKLYKTSHSANKKNNTIKNGCHSYINPKRLKELKSIHDDKFDVTKLIRYCEEINVAFENELYLSTAMLSRSIIDHIPPIFSCDKFSDIANNYKGTKSFKDLMIGLDTSSRKIADSYLHTHIRAKETLPNLTQVDFSNNIDALLEEIYRILK